MYLINLLSVNIFIKSRAKSFLSKIKDFVLPLFICFFFYQFTKHSITIPFPLLSFLSFILYFDFRCLSLLLLRNCHNRLYMFLPKKYRKTACKYFALLYQKKETALLSVSFFFSFYKSAFMKDAFTLPTIILFPSILSSTQKHHSIHLSLLHLSRLSPKYVPVLHH